MRAFFLRTRTAVCVVFALLMIGLASCQSIPQTDAAVRDGVICAVTDLADFSPGADWVGGSYATVTLPGRQYPSGPGGLSDLGEFRAGGFPPAALLLSFPDGGEHRGPGGMMLRPGPQVKKEHRKTQRRTGKSCPALPPCLDIHD